MAVFGAHLSAWVGVEAAMSEFTNTTTIYRPTTGKILEAQLAVVQRLKSRFQNLSAEETTQLASTIIIEVESIWFSGDKP